MDAELEEGLRERIDFNKLAMVVQGGAAVVPAIAQHATSGEVLIVAYANRAALEHTLRERVATFWSTSRGELWIKGATSGDFLDIVDVRVNCEQNSLLYRVLPREEGACHTRDGGGAHRSTCFYRVVEPGGSLRFVEGME